jgi:hypothetical protein
MRRDHDFVCGERRQGVGHRLQRVGVADSPGGAQSGALQPVEARRQPFGRDAARAAVVREPVPQPRVERRRDDEHLRVVQFQWACGVECDDEHIHVSSFD